MSVAQLVASIVAIAGTAAIVVWFWRKDRDIVVDHAATPWLALIVASLGLAWVLFVFAAHVCVLVLLVRAVIDEDWSEATFWVVLLIWFSLDNLPSVDVKLRGKSAAPDLGDPSAPP